MNSTGDNVNFKCIRCGNCCKWPGYVRISETEIAQIAAYLGLAAHDFTAEYAVLTSDRRGLSLKETDRHVCIFYEEPPACKIEPVKPAQCRGFPLKWNFKNWEQECGAAVGNKLKQTV